MINNEFKCHPSQLFSLCGHNHRHIRHSWVRSICQEYQSETYTVGIIPMVGIGFHS
jgi:hypothetical protein